MAQVYINYLESVYFSNTFTHTERIKTYHINCMYLYFCLSLCVAVVVRCRQCCVVFAAWLCAARIAVSCLLCGCVVQALLCGVG